MTAPVCWQYIVKQRHASRARPRPHDFRPNEAVVAAIPFAMAREFIERYEWLGNMGAAKYCYGLFLRGELAAAACYTTPPAPRAYDVLFDPCTAQHIYQLCRGASAHWAPTWAPSKVIGTSLRMMARERAAWAVIAYADPEAGEIGTVYQATNAHYLGLSQSRGPGKYIIGGIEYHARKVQKVFGCAAHRYLIEIDPEYERIQRTKKHRYIFVVAPRQQRRRIIERLRPLVRAYPKRVATIPEAA